MPSDVTFLHGVSFWLTNQGDVKQFNNCENEINRSTHWGRDRMPKWQKIFHWSFFLRFRSTKSQHSFHCNDVIMSAMSSQITSLTNVYSSVYLDADQRKHQSSASLAFVRWIHRRPVNSPHKGPVTRKMFSFDDVLMSDNGLAPSRRQAIIWTIYG